MSRAAPLKSRKRAEPTQPDDISPRSERQPSVSQRNLLQTRNVPVLDSGPSQHSEI